MIMRPDVLAAILAMAAAALACRLGGYFLMRYVRLTPRVEAFLRTIPVALTASILAVAAMKGGPAEWVGIVVALVAMLISRQEFAAVIGGVATVAALRAVL
jgi:uncharacterized membrane protein